MTNRILIVTNCHASTNWTAWLYVGSVLQTSASGRDEGAAVADLVAKFRTARGSR